MSNKVLTAEDCKKIATKYKLENDDKKSKVWILLSKMAITTAKKKKQELQELISVQNLDSDTLFEKAKEYYEQDKYKQAFIFYWLSAQKGNAKAALELAYMYANGEYVSINYKLSIMWHKIAANRGNKDAKKILDSLKKEQFN